MLDDVLPGFATCVTQKKLLISERKTFVVVKMLYGSVTFLSNDEASGRRKLR
ncbi:hypothetical protein Hanom_Chr05g00395451 [Helianthus anomalus]